MKPIARRERIAAIVKETSRVSVEELARMLSTSHETVRRDLALLSERGVVRKVHGGAVHTQTALESPYGDRSVTARAEKLAIAERAAQLFEPGDSLLVDAGSTTAAFAEALARAGHFTVITNSIMVAREMWSASRRSEVYLLGGRYSGERPADHGAGGQQQARPAGTVPGLRAASGRPPRDRSRATAAAGRSTADRTRRRSGRRRRQLIGF